MNEKIIERCSAAVLAVAALATSWSGYQATLWNGDQLSFLSETQRRMQCASRAYTAAGQYRTVDVMTFSSWLAARSADKRELMLFYEQRFRPEMSDAFRAWVATRPLTNADAPALPFNMPQYRVAVEDTGKKCDRESTELYAQAHHANAVSDRYMFATVVFALALFFAGGPTNLTILKLRMTMLGVAAVAVVAGLLLLLRLPAG